MALFFYYKQCEAELAKFNDALTILDIHYCRENYCAYFIIRDSGNGCAAQSRNQKAIARSMVEVCLY